MKIRCTNPKYRSYKDYGGRGISICERWADSFDNFLADMGPKPSRKHSLDRFPEVNGNYEPGNCRWATNTEQQRNKRDNTILEYGGVRACVAEWAEIRGIRQDTLLKRIGKYGWTIPQALGFDPPPVNRRHPLTFQNRTLSMKEWAAETGIPSSVIESRTARGWTVERTLATPKGKCERRSVK